MAEYTLIPTTLSDVSALMAALADLGLSQVEVNEQETVLRDKQGNPQNQRAMIVVRCENSGANADIGFRRSIGGPFMFLVARADRSRFNGAWLRELSQRYRYHFASGRLQQRGYFLVNPADLGSRPIPPPPQSDPTRIKGLQPQGFLGGLLYKIVPGWSERHTVEILVRQPSNPKSTRALAEIVVHFNHEPSRQLALEALQRLTDPACIEQVCEVWAEVRHPDLGNLLVEQSWVARRPPALKVLTALKTGRLDYLKQLEAKDAGLLLEACRDIDPVVAEAAQAYLDALENPGLLDRIAEIWVQSRDASVWKLIETKKYLPRRSIKARVLAGLKLGMEEKIAAGQVNAIEPLVEACSDSDTTIAETARRVLAQLKRADTRQALCEFIIEREAPVAEKIALDAGYLPQEAYKKALFFFVTEQWARYEGLDFDHSLLERAYQTSAPAVKRRLAGKIRKAGRADYLQIITGKDYHSRSVEISPEEAELTVEILSANRDWPKLWPLVFELDLGWSIRIVERLVQAGWQPQREDERIIFEQLKPLALNAQPEQLSGQGQKLLPLALFRARARVAGRVNSLAFSPNRPVIAIGTGTGKVVLWNIHRAERETLLTGFDHSVGRLAFTREAALVCAERTISETDPCKLYFWPGEGTHLVELGQHNGSVRVLQPYGQNQMLSAGRDSLLKLWEVGEHRLQRSLKLYDWVRTACLSEDEQHLALWQDGRVVLLNLPELNLVSEFLTKSIGVARSAVFAPGSETLLAGRFSEGLGVCLKKSQDWRALSVAPGSLGEVSGQVQGLAVVPGQKLVLAATTEGIIRFLEWGNSPRLMGRVQAPTTRLTSLTVSPDGAFMAVGDSDASFSLWDLRVLELGQLFEQPLSRATPRQLAALNAVLESGAELSNSLKELLHYLALVLRHRLRYAIELAEEVPSIQAGDFDIEIEG